MSGDESAFPKPDFRLWSMSPQAPESWTFMGLKGGLTKREFFAVMAMQGFCSGEFCAYGPEAHAAEMAEAKELAKKAVLCADALLAELEKKP